MSILHLQHMDDNSADIRGLLRELLVFITRTTIIVMTIIIIVVVYDIYNTL